jgi:hypothetical protein
MSKSENSSSRPLAYNANSFPWNLRRVTKSTEVNGHTIPHPGRQCAIFVVHGMGEQEWLDTSVTLRSGFEDALEAIRVWQERNLKSNRSFQQEVPPPFTADGFWADYSEPDKTFPEDWKVFGADEKLFYDHLWKKRAYSPFRTLAWLLGQQIRILFLPKARPLARFLYLPLQLILPLAWLLTLLRAPKIITRILADVRLYAHPQGMVERAIVQRIEFRVGKEFLKLLGLDWNFNPLPKDQQVTASGTPFTFKRIIWVSHSLGTVISYNVLSDIFHRAAELEKTGTKVQKKGVFLFRTSLRRFVTLGSPLDKFAVLFRDAMRPWPAESKTGLLETKGDSLTIRNKISQRINQSWWINFYHVLDPVSGSLDHPDICAAVSPINIHSSWKSLALVPGMAHSSYWEALKVLRFILARTYGKEYLHDEDIEFLSSRNRTLFAIAGYCIWAILLYGIVFFIFWFYRDIGQFVWNMVVRM